MKEKITRLLQHSPGQKARDIAKKLGVEKKVVNSYLYNYKKTFIVNDKFEWFVLPDATAVRIVTLAGNAWVDASSFEESLRLNGNLFDEDVAEIIFKLPEKCSVLLDAGARLLSLLNQLDFYRKKVTIDFTECLQTRNFFNRAGFFDLLRPGVIVLPNRPRGSAAKKYKGGSPALVEYGLIDPAQPDDEIPRLLTESFVKHSSDEYYIPAFTVFSELFGNVEEHSHTPIPGYAALQLYKGGKNRHIQTIVSDSGDGIATTLKSALEMHYPDLYSSLDLSSAETDIQLITKAFSEGGLSQFGSDPESGRGLGLNKSTVSAMKFNTKLLVRQKEFALEFKYVNGVLQRVISEINLPVILGTHICYDFYLD